MMIVVRAPLMSDKIRDLLDNKTIGGVRFAFVEKRGMELAFRISGDGIESKDVVGIAKSAIKSTDFGKGIYFSVIKG